MKRYGGIYLSILLIDFLTKRWAMYACQTPWEIHPYLFCLQVFNRGTAWSFFVTDSTIRYILLIAAIVGIVGYVVMYAYYRWLLQHSIIGEVLVVAGATGNLLDRVLYPGVVDFIGLRYNHWVWPLFNLADLAIIAGVCIMSWHLCKEG